MTIHQPTDGEEDSPETIASLETTADAISGQPPDIRRKRLDRLSMALLIAGLVLLGIAALIYLVNPVASITLGPVSLTWRVLSLSLVGLALVLFVGLALRLMVVGNPQWQMEIGCPQCGEQELMRITRHRGDRVLNLVGVPAYRYRCRHCTWEGLRLSEEGLTVSPGALMTPHKRE
jgi:hypothetical protein